MLVSKFTKCISSLLIACYVSITALYADTVPVIVFSDSFTNLTPGHNPAVSPWSTVNYNNFSNWTVTRGSVDVVNLAGDAKPMWFQNYAGPIPSFNFIDLDGTTRQSGEITTKNPLNLAPGNYRLSFDLAGNLGRLPNSEGVMVRLDGLGITQTYELGSEEGFTTKTIDFTVSTPTTTNISFSNDSDDPTTMNDNQGPGLANIVLTNLGAGVANVPEPGTLVVAVGMGLALYVISRFPRKRSAVAHA